jgi:hypothetical protein
MTEDEIAGIGRESCRKTASFINGLGFNPKKTAYSSSERDKKGVVLLHLTDTGKQIWQHPSWSQHGYMGSITTDEQGNVYTSPVPFVNTLDHPLSEMHSIYKIDNKTAEMKLYMKLPPMDTSSDVVPYAVLGLYYDCHGKKLYVASVAGSSMQNENGRIYAIDIQKNTIVDEWKGMDPCGLFVGGMTGEKVLYFGHARSSKIYQIPLTKEGKFKGRATEALSLEGIGPRGDDKARRIRCDKSGNLLVYGLDFNFNLAAQSERPETFYRFGYNREEKKWIPMESSVR